MLEAAHDLRNLSVLPGNRLEMLRGNLKGLPLGEPDDP